MEIVTEYTLIDEDTFYEGREGYHKVRYTRRVCGCTSPGCTSDTLEVWEDEDMSGPSYGVEIEGEIKYTLLGLLEGEYKIIKNEENGGE